MTQSHDAEAREHAVRILVLGRIVLGHVLGHVGREPARRASTR